MPARFIINARHQLDWRQRLLTDAATAGLWVFWLTLMQPLTSLLQFQVSGHFGLAVRPLAMNLFLFGHKSLHWLLALGGTSGLLLAWSRLPVRPAGSLAVSCPIQVASRRHAVCGEQLRSGRGANVCVVHHDEQGRIIAIETRHGAAGEQRAA